MQNLPICPNQLRANGIVIEVCPKHLASVDSPSSHSIYNREQDFCIPLLLKGVTSCFHTRTPTNFEIETCKWIVLSDKNHWDPHSDDFQERENNFVALQDYERNDHNIFSVKSSLSLKPIYSSNMADISHALDDKYLISVSATNTSDRKCNVSAERILSIWNIGLKAAKKTIRCTTQKGIRNVSQPIERRFRT